MEHIVNIVSFLLSFVALVMSYALVGMTLLLWAGIRKHDQKNQLLTFLMKILGGVILWLSVCIFFLIVSESGVMSHDVGVLFSGCAFVLILQDMDSVSEYLYTRWVQKKIQMRSFCLKLMRRPRLSLLK